MLNFKAFNLVHSKLHANINHIGTCLTMTVNRLYMYILLTHTTPSSSTQFTNKLYHFTTKFHAFFLLFVYMWIDEICLNDNSLVFLGYHLILHSLFPHIVLGKSFKTLYGNDKNKMISWYNLTSISSWHALIKSRLK